MFLNINNGMVIEVGRRCAQNWIFFCPDIYYEKNLGKKNQELNKNSTYPNRAKFIDTGHPMRLAEIARYNFKGR